MDIRTLVLGLGVFCATFLIGWWLNVGAIFYGAGAPRAKLPQVKYAQEPQAKAKAKAKAKAASPKPGIRIRRR